MLAFVLATASGLSCGSRPDAVEPRLVVLCATCTLNKHFLEPYDAQVDYTPNLAELARESVVFERHQTESAVSGIAYASLFTGSQADRHGIFHHPARLGDDLLTIFEAFAAAGWETHYFNGHRMAAADLNYAQGVAPEHVYPSQARKRSILSDQDPDFARLLARLQAEPELRVLAVANFTVTHAAYTTQISPAEFAAFAQRFPAAADGAGPKDLAQLAPLYEENKLPLLWDYERTVARLALDEPTQERLATLLQAVYAADVHLLDDIVGRMLATLRASGLLEQTLLAFTADHGEYLRRKDMPFQWGHGLQLAPEALSVPWILRPAAGMFEPGRHAGVTRSIDVFPTLAGLCGVPLPSGAPVSGTDLAPALRGLESPPHLLGMSHTKVLDERLVEEFRDLEAVRALYPRIDPALMWTAVRDGDRFFRWRNAGDERFVCQAFDLAADPLGEHDLFDPENSEHQGFQRWLEDYKEALTASYGGERGVDSEQIEADLRALGYVR